MEKKIVLAVVLTTYNRCKLTLQSLTSLLSECEYDYDIFICDDASSDGTVEMIRNNFNNTHIVEGTGDLYWTKGMYRAMEKAYEGHYDFYLMINDDVVFFQHAIDELLNTYHLIGEHCGIVGIMTNKKIDKTTYGGKNLSNELEFIDPNGSPQECDLANWNCFLLDNEVLESVGLIDNYYAHSYGDYDYSLMMKRKGYKIYCTPGYVGICERNTGEGSYRDTSLSRIQRLRKWLSPKGMHIKSGFHFLTKNFDFYGMKGLVEFLTNCIKEIIKIMLRL